MKNNTRSSCSRAGIKIVGVAVAVASLVCKPAYAAEDRICQLVFDAMAKSIVTPNQLYLSLTMASLNGGKPKTSETINTGKTTYINYDVKWQASMSTQALLDQMLERRKSAIGTCRFVRNEMIDGFEASLYAVREGGPSGGPADSKVWLEKRSGLPIHVDFDIEGVHRESRYIYGAVSAPPLN